MSDCLSLKKCFLKKKKKGVLKDLRPKNKLLPALMQLISCTFKMIYIIEFLFPLKLIYVMKARQEKGHFYLSTS